MEVVYQLIRYTNIATKEINSNIIEVGEIKPFEIEIQLRLINWKDLEIPKDWILDSFTKEKP